MRPIDKFILHVVHNWKNKLNEAYGKEVMNNIIKKFKEEADDLNISITDQQLKAYIERFDGLKDSPKIVKKDIQTYTLSELIKLVTASKGAKEEVEEIDITPDVVYNNDDNTIVVYNGSKEDNCITYGRGERWCITKSSFGTYRYNKDKGYPTFYLAKNNNLSDSDPLSFVAIQVRDVSNPSKQYVYTKRNNSPYESDPMSFDNLLSQVPWLREIPNIKDILKYIPLSNQEKLTQQYRNTNVSIKEWMKFPYSVKEQYLVVKKGNQQIFSDISNDEFVSKYLPKYPQLAVFVAKNYGIIKSQTLLKHLDSFADSDRRSIIANMQDKIPADEYLSSASFPFDVKKLLVKLDKWELSPNERVYTTKDGSTIVKLTLGDDIKVGLYQEEDDYPNIKLNKRTSKYLLDYPDLDKIPVKNLINLVANEVIDKSVLDNVLEKAKTNPNSAIIVKDNIILDSNSFSSYKIENGKINKIPFNNEEVQAVFNSQKDNESFQQNALSLLKDDENIPDTIDKEGFISLLKAIPYDRRIVQWRNSPAVILTTDSEEYPIIVMDLSKGTTSLQISGLYGYGGDWRRKSIGTTSDNVDVYRAYYDYLRSQNKAYSGDEFVRVIKNMNGTQSKKSAIAAQPPIADSSPYRPYVQGDDYYIVNINNPRESFVVSNNSGKLNKANLPTSIVARLRGGAAEPAAAAATPAAVRRGRPAGQPNAPQPAAAPAAQGDINVSNVMEETGLQTAFLRLSQIDRRGYRNLNVNNASRVDPNNDRGATRRNNILGNAGRVGRVIQIGASKIYIIRLANQQIVASVNIQPGNRNYLLTGNANGNVAVSLDSPSQLLQVLQQRNLAEIHQYLVNEYMERNPEHLTEFKELLRKHINEKKNASK
jgi:hypothetical protein